MNQYPPLYNEFGLLQQVSAGSEPAFTKIFEHYHKRIYSVSMRFLKSSSSAEEIVQDVFLKLWLKRTELKDIKRLDNYLFIMARNCIVDRLKKMGYESDLQSEMIKGFKSQSSIDDSEYLIRQHQCQQLIQEAVGTLSPQQKQVYILAKVEFLSHQMIADRMGISRLTVKTHMAKALQTIRLYLDTHLHLLQVLALLASFYIR